MAGLKHLGPRAADRRRRRVTRSSRWRRAARVISVARFRWLSHRHKVLQSGLALLVVLSGCSQSLATFDPPAPPCASGRSFVVGGIEAVGAGCVTVRVERVVRDGSPVSDQSGRELFDGAPEVGVSLRGYLATVYAYKHEFQVGESVALFVYGRYDQLALELFPFEDERVEVLWGRQSFSLALEELSADACSSELLARRVPERDTPSNTSGTFQTSPAPPEPMCGL